MASTYKVLGQSAPAAATVTNIYTVPASTSAVVSTLSICNRGSGTVFDISIRPAGATLANQHYVAYQQYIQQNDTVFLSLGISLAATDVITVKAGTANLSFSVFGSEIV